MRGFCGACLREVYAASLARPAGRAAGVVFLGARSVFLFRRFEKLVTTYPEATPATPPRGFFAFLWACTAGMRPYLVLMTALTAVIGAFEALLFAMLGQVVDWLSRVEPAQLWAEERGNLLLLAAVLAPARWSSRCSRYSSTRRCSATSRCCCAGTSIG